MSNNFDEVFQANGYVCGNPILNESEIIILRNLLDSEFSKNTDYKGAGLLIHKFQSFELAKKIIKILFSKEVTEIITKLQKNSEEFLSILPLISVHKNYHNNLNETLGWHRDCGGELAYEYCKNKLSDKNYLFTKIGIYLQENTNYGGCIDIIKNSHKNFSKSTIIIRKIRSFALKMTLVFHKFFKKLYLKIPERFFMILINAKTLNPKKSSPLFFDSRLIHRGTPISKDLIKTATFEKKYQIRLDKMHTKYVIYSQFGNALSIDSYMFDRLKRKDGRNEIKLWVDQINFIDQIDKTLANKIKLALGPIKHKYNFTY